MTLPRTTAVKMMTRRDSLINWQQLLVCILWLHSCKSIKTSNWFHTFVDKSFVSAIYDHRIISTNHHHHHNRTLSSTPLTTSPIYAALCTGYLVGLDEMSSMLIAIIIIPHCAIHGQLFSFVSLLSTHPTITLFRAFKYKSMSFPFSIHFCSVQFTQLSR